ncbi:hypothetical protein BDZ91DRAFT_737599 [Kalaharituber pfeilii]|nr:hypothetical protein BDZ91DRAFT_737599 [Kalaharituber pfeilii]
MDSIALPAWALFLLYWLITIFTSFVLKPPNPTPSHLSPVRESLFMTVAANPTFLTAVRYTFVAGPATLLTLFLFLQSYQPTSPLIPLLCPHHTHPTALRTFHTLTPISALGILLTLIASPLRFLCYAQLGKAFTFHITLPPDKKLVTTGMYRYLRHPSYVTAFLAGAGFIMTFADLDGPAVTCVLGPRQERQKILDGMVIAGIILWVSLAGYGFKVRTAKEEEFLEKEFGDEWREYKKRTWKVIPFVY